MSRNEKTKRNQQTKKETLAEMQERLRQETLKIRRMFGELKQTPEETSNKLTK